MNGVAVAAAVAAFLQFIALLLTIGVMIRNGHRQLRAYVLPENGGILDGTMLNPPQPARAGIPGVVLLIKNSGQTPAYEVVHWAQIEVVPVQDENRALVVPPMQKQYSSTLGSGGMTNKALWCGRALTPGEILEVANGTRAIYLFGRIEYKDAFKKPHFTNFRLHYIGQFPPVPGAILYFSERGNDSN